MDSSGRQTDHPTTSPANEMPRSKFKHPVHHAEVAYEYKSVLSTIREKTI